MNVMDLKHTFVNKPILNLTLWGKLLFGNYVKLERPESKIFVDNLLPEWKNYAKMISRVERRNMTQFNEAMKRNSVR